MQETSNERQLTARDLQTVADLTYRQLNDWDQKGALPRRAKRGSGWRKFTVREVFTVMVCAELRRRFGVSLDKLAVIQKAMLSSDRDFLADAALQMIDDGESVWLGTDLEKFLHVFHESNFEGPFEFVWFTGGVTDAAICLRLDPIVNRLLGHLKPGFSIPRHSRRLDLVREIDRDARTASTEARELLEMVHSGNYSTVELSIKHGRVDTMKGTTRIDSPDTDDVLKMINAEDYQSINLTKKAGKLVSLVQIVPRKAPPVFLDTNLRRMGCPRRS